MILSPQQFASTTTLVHPFALYFPGHATSMGLAYTVAGLFGKDDSTVIYDGGGWLLPLGILFSRDEDRLAFEELLSEFGFTFIGNPAGVIHIAAWSPVDN